MKLNQPPKASSQSSEIVDRPLIITAVGEPKVIETSIGESTAISVDMLVLDWDAFEDKEGLLEKKNVLIFWGVVQRQLLSEDFVTPVAGIIEKNGRAYVFNPLDDTDMEKVSALLEEMA